MSGMSLIAVMMQRENMHSGGKQKTKKKLPESRPFKTDSLQCRRAGMRGTPESPGPARVASNMSTTTHTPYHGSAPVMFFISTN